MSGTDEILQPNQPAKFGRLRVIKRNVSFYRTTSGATVPRHLCRCECGNTKAIRHDYLLSGHTRSCGCRRGQFRHGAYKTKLYQVWQAMKDRCHNPTNTHFAEYGGRGIQVCERWQSFEAFAADMGNPPKSGLTLERNDNNGNYEPDNCRWATRAEQQRNRRNNVWLELDGKRAIAKDWADSLGLKHHSLMKRIRAGWTMRDALTKPRQEAFVRQRRSV